MKRVLSSMMVLVVLLALAVGPGVAQGPQPTEPITAQAAVGTAFTYQGRLTDGGSPANAAYDFQFKLYDALNGGSQVGSTVPVPDQAVADGLFTVQLDFGSDRFDGNARYLEIGVRPGNSGGAYTTLSPRQALTPAPYALALPGLWTRQNATSPNLIGGYSGNSATSGVVGATIGGGGISGFTNRVTDNYGTVGGGAANLAGNNAGTTSDRPYATVGGGYSNGASNDYATVGGGEDNTASDSHTTVGGGEDNIASGSHATIGGGASNEASGDDATVGGGMSNGATGGWATVGGGGGNEASGDDATVGGGFGNWAASDWATVGGGGGNEARSYYATVGGGRYNEASGSHATVGGGDSNAAAAAGAFVGGGGYDGSTYSGNQAWGRASTISGGYGNVISTTGVYATVGGGDSNAASGEGATVGGGDSNEASGDHATVGGGYGNEASGDYATVGGGASNEASDDDATVGGGASNEASGSYDTVPGGYDNTASGGSSFAAGYQANATHWGSFVWASGASTSSWGSNTFTVRSHGGARFYTAAGTLTGVQLAANGNAWASISDRNVKENFADVASSRLLAALATVPIQTWNLKAQPPEMRHIGPVAQDFNGMFGYLFGQVESPVHINTMDAVGVSLAASQELYRLYLEQKAENAALKAQSATQQQVIEDLQKRLAALEQRVSGGGGGQ